MNLVIIGGGKVGKRIADQLVKEGHDIVVIDKNRDALDEIGNKLDVMCIEGTAVDPDTLAEAGVGSADCVIACTSSDEVNMICSLIAKKSGALRTIARVRNPEYYDQMPYIKDDLGIDMAINPELSAANTLSRVLLFPVANSVQSFFRGHMELIGFHVAGGNRLAGMKIRDINAQFNVHMLICVIERENEVIIPNGADEIRESDNIYIAGKHDELQKFFQEIDAFKSSVNSVILIGGGKMTYYMARKLLMYGMDVKIIERDIERCNELAELLPQAIIVNTDGTNNDMLIEEGIDRADAVVPLTGIDEINVILSYFAKQRGVPTVATKVNQLSFVDTVKSFGVDAVASPRVVTADEMVQFVRAMQAADDDSTIIALNKLVNGKAESLEFKISGNAEVTNKPLSTLSLRKGILVACINRGGEIIFPGGSDCIEAGDNVVVITTDTGIKSIDEILKKD